ncbi:ImmA/IrrE family metallo-endopeptidase [Xylophilus sp. Kf1]|nr:ImmA/IrrE family metallo-endopeptidase [Xylophilus sp. Kf1]
MNKKFVGVRLRKLRAERGLSQGALARALGLSASYVNQIEQNQRPLTLPVLLKISQVLGVELQRFAEDEETRLVAGMQEALADNPGGEAISLTELREVASQMPAVGRALLALHRRNREWMARLETMADGLGDGRGDGRGGLVEARPMPFEVVRDFFFVHQNYFDPLDLAAEALAGEVAAHGAPLTEWLLARLMHRHGVKVQAGDAADDDSQRRYDPATRVLRLSAELGSSQQAFQMGTQLALLEQAAPIDRLTQAPELPDEPSRLLARIGLANYFAGALMLPYGVFLQAAEALRYDIDLLARRFGVGFETVCHRLSTLQRPQQPGVPFFFIRVDRAGNISKRQSATHFHFSKSGGTCPLWNVYEAFAQPDKVLTQLARMPDGRAYLWVARTVSHGQRGYGSPRKTFAIGLGCDLRHAPRLVYSKGLDLKDHEVPTPIGMGCKVCEREACPQRAFPFSGRPLDVNENDARFTPYAVTGAAGPGAPAGKAQA